MPNNTLVQNGIKIKGVNTNVQNVVLFICF